MLGCKQSPYFIEFEITITINITRIGRVTFCQRFCRNTTTLIERVKKDQVINLRCNSLYEGFYLWMVNVDKQGDRDQLCFELLKGLCNCCIPNEQLVLSSQVVKRLGNFSIFLDKVLVEVRKAQEGLYTLYSLQGILLINYSCLF